jgi:hypothetical protein
MLEVYPIGRATFPTAFQATTVRDAIDRIEALPAALRGAVAGCRDLDHPIRTGAWSIRVLVHHVADSHLNAYARTKLALTEDAPLVRAYDEVAWSRLGDAAVDVGASLALLEALHVRWVAVLRAVGPDGHARPWRHPAAPAPQPLWQLPLAYAWHGDHHLAQVRQARRHFGI